jgi:hypothetical protein
MTMTRKQFLGAMVGAAGAAVLAACGGDDGGGGGGDDAATRSCTMNGTTVNIGANHDHVVTVPKEDVIAGTEQTYTLTGGGHTHMITLTAAHFTMLQNNETVSVSSTSSGAHTHSVSVQCA